MTKQSSSESRSPLNRVLVFGPGRSGTTWLIDMLSHSGQPMRCLSEGTFEVYKQMTRNTPSYEPLNPTNDPTGSNYQQDIDASHPVVQIYELLADSKFDIEQAFREISAKRILRNDVGFRHFVIKEVHSLQCLEALVRHYDCRSVVLFREPFSVLDSVWRTFGHRQLLEGRVMYLEPEVYFLNQEHLGDPQVCYDREALLAVLRGYQRRDPKLYFAMLKYAVLKITMASLLSICRRDARILPVLYHDLAMQTESEMSRICEHVGIECDTKLAEYVGSFQRIATGDAGGYEVKKNPRQVLNHRFKFMSRHVYRTVRKRLDPLLPFEDLERFLRSGRGVREYEHWIRKRAPVFVEGGAASQAWAALRCGS